MSARAPRKSSAKVPRKFRESSAGQNLSIEWWPIARPKPYPANARKLSERAVETLALSLKQFGWRQPIVVDLKDVIVAGHTRLLAAQACAMAFVPVHVARELTAAQIRAYRIMDNRSADETEWDMPTLAAELAELAALEVDLGTTGFVAAELAEILKPDPLTGEDDVPPVPETPVTKLGDLWLMGGHRVLCGDCRKASDVKTLIGRDKVNVVFTSPPYAKQRDYGDNIGRVDAAKYVEWFKPAALNILSHLASDGSYFLNIKAACDGLDMELYVMDLVLAHARAWGFHLATEFCWQRNGVPKSVTQRFKNQFEPIYQFVTARWKMRPDAVRHESANVPRAGGRGSGETSWARKQGGRGNDSVPGSFGGAKKRRNGRRDTMSDAQGTNVSVGEYIGPGFAYPGNRLPTFSFDHEATGHVAAFPPGLARFFALAYTDAADVIYDPFSGSGSVLMAAETENRKFRGLELAPAYVDVIVARWQAFTGQAATLEGDGRTFDAIAKARAKKAKAA